MNYFTSCLYGDFDKYSRIKESLHLKDTDRLWILGDILDGNDEDPEAAMEIMGDIMDSANVSLILGDHEYARCMEYSLSQNTEYAQSWREFSETFEVSGTVFNEFIRNNLTNDARETYIAGFLINCELSAVVSIGRRYFYLVHGKPVIFRRDFSVPAWQMDVCTKTPDFKENLWRGIKTDEMSAPFLGNVKNPMTPENTIVISGQLSPADAAKCCHTVYDGKLGIFFSNNILAIGRNYPDEPLPVTGIDAAGFFVQGIY